MIQRGIYASHTPPPRATVILRASVVLSTRPVRPNSFRCCPIDTSPQKEEREREWEKKEKSKQVPSPTFPGRTTVTSAHLHVHGRYATRHPGPIIAPRHALKPPIHKQPAVRVHLLLDPRFQRLPLPNPSPTPLSSRMRLTAARWPIEMAQSCTGERADGGTLSARRPSHIMIGTPPPRPHSTRCRTEGLEILYKGLTRELPLRPWDEAAQ